MLLTTKDLPIQVLIRIKGVRAPSVTHLRRTITKKDKKQIWRTGTCTWCWGKTTGRRTSWCSDRCVDMFLALRSQVDLVRQRDKGICQICLAPSPVIEVDHIIPVCENGLTIAENLRSLCRDCHKKESAQLMKRLALNRKLDA